MVRPERFELPTLWFEGEIRKQHTATPPHQKQQNIDNFGSAIGWPRTELATLHGQNADRTLTIWSILSKASFELLRTDLLGYPRRPSPNPYWGVDTEKPT